jgi:hypothetical protein
MTDDRVALILVD